MADVDGLGERLGEDVGDVVVCVALDQLDCAIEHLVAHEVILVLDVLRALVVNWVLGEVNAPLVVLEDGQRQVALVLLLCEETVVSDADVVVAQILADADEPDALLRSFAQILL